MALALGDGLGLVTRQLLGPSWSATLHASLGAEKRAVFLFLFVLGGGGVVLFAWGGSRVFFLFVVFLFVLVFFLGGGNWEACFCCSRLRAFAEKDLRARRGVG